MKKRIILSLLALVLFASVWTGTAAEVVEQTASNPAMLTNNDITISVTSTAVQTGQDVTVTVSAPGASGIRLYSCDEYGYEYLRQESSSNTLQYEYGKYVEGHDFFFATACYNGVWSENRSEMIEVIFSAPHGYFPAPSINYSLSGNQLTVTVPPVDGVEEYSVSLYKDRRIIGSARRESAGNFAFTLSENGNYRVLVYISAQGWNETYNSKTVPYNAQTDSGIAISASNLNPLAGERVTLTVSAPKAEALRLYMISGTGIERLMKETEDNNLQHVYSNLNASSVSFYATACYNGEWSTIGSRIIDLAFSVPYGSLKAPKTSYSLSGSQLTVTVQPVEHAGDYYVALEKDGYEVSRIIRETAGDFDFTLPDDGDYSVYVLARAVGWTSASVTVGIHRCGENATWSLSDDGTLTISGTGDMFSYYGEDTPWNRQDVKKLVVEAGITRVGGNAFMDCYNLTEVSLPGGLRRIGKSAFAFCYNLPEIDLPDTVDSIGASAFMGCEKLEEIVVPEGVTNVGFGTFQYCSGLKKVTLPNSLERIGNYVFCWCSNLSSIMIPENVTYIGNYAFYGCEQLRAVRLPGNMAYIGNVAFDSNSLWGLFCPSAGQGPAWAQDNGVNAFLLDKNILTLPAGTATIESEAFAELGENVTVVIPASVKQIAPNAFDGSTVAFRCAEDSAAAGYAAEHSIPIVPD